MGNITIEAQRSSAASTTDNSTTATSQYDDDQERRDLYNFVTNHYVLDTSTGEVHYKCICLYPNNCSIWLHHPNLDETIAELVESATSVTPPAAGTKGQNRSSRYRAGWKTRRARAPRDRATDWRPGGALGSRSSPRSD